MVPFLPKKTPKPYWSDILTCLQHLQQLFACLQSTDCSVCCSTLLGLFGIIWYPLNSGNLNNCVQHHTVPNRTVPLSENKAQDPVLKKSTSSTSRALVFSSSSWMPGLIAGCLGRKLKQRLAKYKDLYGLKWGHWQPYLIQHHGHHFQRVTKVTTEMKKRQPEA